MLKKKSGRRRPLRNVWGKSGQLVYKNFLENLKFVMGFFLFSWEYCISLKIRV